MSKISYGKDQDLDLKLVIALTRSVQHVRKNESPLFQQYGLTISQFGVMEILYHKGDLRVCEIIEKALSTGGNMTVVIQNLVKEGWITRQRDPADGRAWIIHLSEKGHDLMGRMFPEHADNISRIMGNLEGQEKEVLLGLLKKLTGKES